MKRKTLLLTILTLLICVPVFAGTIIYKLYPASYPILVDGEQLRSSLPVMSYQANGGANTYVPLRAVLDMMGANTVWNGKAVDITQVDTAKVADSVVEIYACKGNNQIAQGSGVIIDYDEIMTNSHVAKLGDSYRIIYNDGTTTTASLIKDKPSEDIAVLEPIRKDVKPCKIGDSDEVKVGDKVFCISSPKGKKNVILQGKTTYLKECNGYYGIWTSIGVIYGGSGGGLFNARGELIGITEAGDKEQSFAIPINDARKVN
ncbi:MAG: S1C family serine protease [Deltaproteobacteria bacterium]